MLKWSVSSVSANSQQNSEVDNCSELSEKEEKNRDADEKLEEEAGDETEGREGEESGEGEEEARQLPAFRRRNYLVGGDSHLVRGGN